MSFHAEIAPEKAASVKWESLKVKLISLMIFLILQFRHNIFRNEQDNTDNSEEHNVAENTEIRI